MQDLEVIIGTEYDENEEAAVSEAREKLLSTHSCSIWRKNIYGGDGEQQIGVGFNVEVPDDEAEEAIEAFETIAESVQRI